MLEIAESVAEPVGQGGEPGGGEVTVGMDDDLRRRVAGTGHVVAAEPVEEA